MTWIHTFTSVQDGRTALYCASYRHVAVVELLLQANADISICDEVLRQTSIVSSVNAYMYIYICTSLYRMVSVHSMLPVMRVTQM